MKKLTLTALTATICSLSLATIVAPAFAQPTGTTTPGGTTPTIKTTPATTTPAIKPAPTGTTPGTKATPSAAPTQNQIVDELKLSKEQQTKLAKLKQSVIQKNVAVLTPSQKEQLRTAMQQGKAPALTLTTDQQNQLKAIQADALKQQDAILTTEQKQKLKAIEQKYNSGQMR